MQNGCKFTTKIKACTTPFAIGGKQMTTGGIKEIEVMMRKEIKNFMENSTIKQFEDKLIEKIGKEIKRGKLEGDVKDITLRMFREFYQFMWMNRSYWEPRLKNA